MATIIKTEHAGAKNGRGYWGKREQAKRVSKSRRRINSKREVHAELIEHSGAAVLIDQRDRTHR